MLAKEMKSGAVVVDNDVPIIIESVTVQSPSARGAATLYKIRFENLVTGQKRDESLKGDYAKDKQFRVTFQRRINDIWAEKDQWLATQKATKR